MGTTVKYFPPIYWKDAVATASALPTDALEGEARVTLDTGVIYVYISGAWTVAAATPAGSTLIEGSVYIGDSSDLADAVDTLAQGDIQASSTGLNIKAGVIVNNDVNSTAAIAHSKMAALTASRVAVTDASGVVSTSTVTSARLVELEVIPTVTHEPTGFENRTDSTISFNPGTMTFTVAPVGASFNYWIGGAKYTVSAPLTALIPSVTAVYYLYLNGTLQQSVNFPDVTASAIVAIVYWNESTGSYVLAEERHGIQMDGSTHAYLHLTRGAVWASGGNATFTLASTTQANNQIALAETTYYDEDIRHVLAAFAKGDSWSKWYEDASGDWIEDATIGDATIPVHYAAAGDIGWNNITTGTIDPVGVNDYVNVFIFGTNSATSAQRLISLCGQADHANPSAAYAETVDTIEYGQLPTPEFVPMYQITYQKRAGGVGSQINRMLDIRAARSPGVSAVGATTHNSLSGLQGGAPAEYFHLSSANEANLTGGAPSFATSVTTPLVDTSGALSLGTSSATSVSIGKAGITTTIAGDLIVSGDTITANVATVLIEDNLLVLNNGEVGAGVTAGLSGIQVDRGSLTDYQFIFDETSDSFKVGEIGSLQKVATREDTPNDNMFGYWDASTSKFETTGSPLGYNGTDLLATKTIEVPTTSFVRFGTDTADSWRVGLSGGNLVLQKKVGSTWTLAAEFGV